MTDSVMFRNVLLGPITGIPTGKEAVSSAAYATRYTDDPGSPRGPGPCTCPPAGYEAHHIGSGTAHLQNLALEIIKRYGAKVHSGVKIVGPSPEFLQKKEPCLVPRMPLDITLTQVL